MARGPQARISRFIRGWIRSLGLRKFGIGVLAKTPQGLFVVDPKDFGVGRSLLDSGAYETEVVDYLLDLTSPRSTVVFVGAHIGSILVPVAESVSKVIAFEPNPLSFELLTTNVQLNKLDNVDLHRLAVSDCNGFVTISHDAQNTGKSFVSKSGSASGQKVESKRLDDSVSDEPIDLMVVDAEGHEVQVFAGAQQTLRRTKVLYTEYCPRLLHNQGSSPEMFTDMVTENFTRMRPDVGGTVQLDRKQWVPYLKGLAGQERLLLNLTFFSA